jgi:pyridinium-3,5-biscarboxylic acid mononucleotide sulfurtransferase
MNESSIFEHKVHRAAEILQELKRVLVAFSGGVDSSVLLKLAVDTLGGNNVLAVTAVGPLHPTWERQRAEEIAQLIGARHVFAEDPACRQSEFMKNTPQRCYFCKKALLEELANLAEEYRVKTIVAGENADDQFDYRPGCKAMMELGVRCPLKESHISKAEVRFLARRWNLPNYAAPASPCLVTRIPYGQPITTDLLRQIEQAEGYLHELGFEVARVRVHGPIARIEIHEDEISRFFEINTRSRVLAKFKDLGFTYTSVDLEGYQSGSLNKLVDTAAQV